MITVNNKSIQSEKTMFLYFILMFLQHYYYCFVSSEMFHNKLPTAEKQV